MKRVIQTLAISLMAIYISLVSQDTIVMSEEIDVKEPQTKIENRLDIELSPSYPINFPITKETKSEEKQVSEEEIKLIALVTLGEAEGESEEGQRLVISTILNRVDSEEFPNDISSVIYQPSQFTCMWNGRIDKVILTDEMCQLVKEELSNRTNKEVIFFTAGNYSTYGNPLFKVGNHYFSSY